MTLAGESPPIAGAGSAELGAEVVNGNAFELTVRFDTETCTVPCEAVSAAVIVAVSCVGLTNTVARGEPFQFTTDPFTKFVPVTVRVKLVVPQDGADDVEFTDDDSEEMVGATIVNIAAAGAGVVWVVPPPGPIVNTATWALPRVWKSVAGTVAVSCVPLT